MQLLYTATVVALSDRTAPCIPGYLELFTVKVVEMTVVVSNFKALIPRGL